MQLLVTGGTGFIGTPLCHALTQHGHTLFVLTRRPPGRAAQGRVRLLAWDANEWPPLLGQVDGVINLAGESLAAQRWTANRKRILRESRVQTTRRLIEAMARQPKRPAVLISASAIGYYGPHDERELTEADPPGTGFLAELCRAWEAEAERAQPLGVRVVRLRIGMVLGPGGGILAKMLPPFQCFLGGPLGSGRQWISWIQLGDLIGLIEWALTRQELSGAMNATAPAPCTMQALCDELGRAVHRPSWAPVPAVMLRFLFGEMADMLLTGQRVVPRAALQCGYRFTHPALPAALQASLR